MTNETKATVISITVITALVASFFIEPMGRLLVGIILGLILVFLGGTILVLTYQILKENLLDPFKWIDRYKERKSGEMKGR